MNKKYLIFLSLIWVFLGVLVAVPTVKSIILGEINVNIILMAGLTLFCFYNGGRGIFRVFGKSDGDGNEETGCSGG